MAGPALRIGLMARGDRGGPVGGRSLTMLEPLRPRFAELGVEAEHVIYADDAAAEVRDHLLGLDGVLVWINPIQDGHDRAGVDALLRDVAARGVWVSAAPDAITKMGTKEVLFQTRHLGWGTDCEIYRSTDELARRLPALLRRQRVTVLKQSRGNGGNGVWRVDLVGGSDDSDLKVRVLQAQPRDAEAEEVNLKEFIKRCSDYFAWSGSLISQPYIDRLGEGMIRCYFVHDQVVGFCHQRPKGLLDATEAASPTAASPSVMEDAEATAYQSLRTQIEREWVPQMQEVLQLETEGLPVIWDADLLFGPQGLAGEDTYVLCEINVSCVWPFPPAAMPRIVEAATGRIKAGRALRASAGS